MIPSLKDGSTPFKLPLLKGALIGSHCLHSYSMQTVYYFASHWNKLSKISNLGENRGSQSIMVREATVTETALSVMVGASSGGFSRGLGQIQGLI